MAGELESVGALFGASPPLTGAIENVVYRSVDPQRADPFVSAMKRMNMVRRLAIQGSGEATEYLLSQINKIISNSTSDDFFETRAAMDAWIASALVHHERVDSAVKLNTMISVIDNI